MTPWMTPRACVLAVDDELVLDIARWVGANRALAKPLDKETLLQAVAELPGPVSRR